ncbi:MAG: ABC transporter permease subunit [Bacteroidia bacterium]|nr:ABC transporter permease subunit [Bacteroidia bacterium]
MGTIFRKEVGTFFNSLIAYVVISVFLIGTGLFFWVFEYNILESGITQMDALFDFGPYMFLFLVPAITMRAFSEEMKTGTIEFLFTKPLTDWQIILGKYLAGIFLVFFSLLPSVIYYLSTYWLGILESSPQLGINAFGEILAAPFLGESNLDTGATWGAYLGLFAIGCIFTSLGLLTSAITDNQIVAFILAVFLCFFFYTGFDFLAGIQALDGINALFLNMSILQHYESISRGVIDSRDILFFLSFISCILILTKIILAQRMV